MKDASITEAQVYTEGDSHRSAEDSLRSRVATVGGMSYLHAKTAEKLLTAQLLRE